MTFFIGKLVRFIAVYGLNSYNKHSHKTPSNNKLVRKARTRFTYEEQIGACLIRFLDYARNDIEDCRSRCAPLRMTIIQHGQTSCPSYRFYDFGVDLQDWIFVRQSLNCSQLTIWLSLTSGSPPSSSCPKRVCQSKSPACII